MLSLLILASAASQEEALTITRTDETVLKKPGYEIWPIDWYEAERGSLETNCKKRLGHYESTDSDNNRVIIVPVTKVEFNERHSVHRTCEAGKTSDGVDPSFLAKRQKAVASTLALGHTGDFLKGNLFEEVLQMPGATPASSTSSHVATQAWGQPAATSASV